MQWPPYFNHPFYSILPIIAWPAFLFYDALASFCAPTSYIMSARKTRDMFPQLQDVLYSAVYCEAMHNDARTGTAIALTAALEGATIANYVEMTGYVYGGPDGSTVTGIKVKDNATGEQFEIKAKAVVLATGPFLDSIRKMANPDAPKAVAAAAGAHRASATSPLADGLLWAAQLAAPQCFLPWLGHTVVGSTDKKCDATSSPTSPRTKSTWSTKPRRAFPRTFACAAPTLSAWQGWRPLYRDPNAPPGAPSLATTPLGTTRKPA